MSHLKLNFNSVSILSELGRNSILLTREHIFTDISDLLARSHNIVSFNIPETS